METAVATGFLGRIVPKLFAFLQEKHELQRSLEHDIRYIHQELRMIHAAIQDHDHGDGGGGDVQSAWIQLVRELAYETEDCFDRFMHRVTPETDASRSWIRHRVHGVKTATSRHKFAAAIRELRKISEEASKLRASYSSGSSSGASASTTTLSVSSSETHTLASDLVGMDAPRDELLEMIRGHPNRLKVISIVGFGGLGKTLLARQVYESHAVVCQHQPRLWIPAAPEKDAPDVLKEILQELGVQVVHDCSVNWVITNIRMCLGAKRFFIVIDDLRKEFWNIIKNAFPRDTGASSTVLVTTPIHSVANACSAAHGHVYVMTTLDEEHSRKLFFKEASVEPDTGLGSEALKKCDGLPLALVTTGQFLQSRGNPTRTEWAKLCDNLGEHLEAKDTLARMKQVLVRSYTSLPDHVLKACLLYLSIFPSASGSSGRRVRRKSLERRWLAEGFVEEFGVATDKFKELLDRSILQPVDVGNNTEVKTCQTHGMMLEFILRKSTREGFITLLRDGQARLPSKIRWLSLHHYSGNPNKDLSLVRSLTIFGKAHKSMFGFSKYELLRVLDLKECDHHLDDKHLLEICNLLLLRYLSLGRDTVTVLPKEISKLKFLETLDVTRSKITALPIQVLKMTRLIHVLGVFKLDGVGHKMIKKLQTVLSEKSNLETLAGFVADESEEFPQLMDHMNKLTKVKIWCESAADASSNLTHLSKAIQGFIQRGTDVNDVRSLSLKFNEWSGDLLNFSLENSCYLSSLKLQGNIGSLPPFVNMLGGLTELCLSSRNQLNGNVLAALSRVRSLHYLRLVTGHLEQFIIQHPALESLRRLHIAVQFTTGIEIKDGALPRLESLRLLCKDLNAGIKIECLGRLKEVALHDGVSEQTKMEWKEAAKNHPRRPKVLFVKTEQVDDQNQMQMASDCRTDDNCSNVSRPLVVAT